MPRSATTVTPLLLFGISVSAVLKLIPANSAWPFSDIALDNEVYMYDKACTPYSIPNA